MAIVVFLKGINVGGHRTFRPSALADDLRRFDVVNAGAAGTLVVRAPVRRAEIRSEIASRLPFDVDVMICNGSDILRLAARDPFAAHEPDPNVVQFVSVMGTRRKPPFDLPMHLPAEGAWGLRVLACYDSFVVGEYRREMKALRYLGQLERMMGTAFTTRSWSTISAIVRILQT